MSLTKEELQIIEIMKDPVKWAKFELGITARWYQDEILHSDDDRLLVRMGRRTGKTYTLEMKALHYAATHPGSVQLIVTPYESQVSTIFDEMKTMLAGSKTLKDCIPSMTKSPHIITFSNGAKIKGFTSGARSGQEAASLRGQKADWVYMDEADYLTDKDIESIVAIATQIEYDKFGNRKRKGLWMSSTPSGRRGKFWFFATSRDAGWKQFHYPSSVQPGWDVEEERKTRLMFSENAYKQEILAEFGDEEAGVFNKEFIDAARHKYNYINGANSGHPRIVGVDWDKYGAATQIVIMQFDRDLNKFIILNRIEIPIGRFTLSNAVDEIVRVNQRFNPDYVYVDRGFGEHQVETLHKYGIAHPESGLAKKVIGASFQETVMITDPFTRERTKGTLKPFAVNQMVILLEQERLMISDSDQVIWKQMEDYRVKHTNINGQPVFEDENDHALSAIMLAVYGFYQKFPTYMETVPIVLPTTKVKHTSSDIIYSYPKQITEKDRYKKDAWDEPGYPPPKKVEGSFRKQDKPFLQRGGSSSSDLKKGFGRRFW